MKMVSHAGTKPVAVALKLPAISRAYRDSERVLTTVQYVLRTRPEEEQTTTTTFSELWCRGVG